MVFFLVDPAHQLMDGIGLQGVVAQVQLKGTSHSGQEVLVGTCVVGGLEWAGGIDTAVQVLVEAK